MNDTHTLVGRNEKSNGLTGGTNVQVAACRFRAIAIGQLLTSHTWDPRIQLSGIAARDGCVGREKWSDWRWLGLLVQTSRLVRVSVAVPAYLIG